MVEGPEIIINGNRTCMSMNELPTPVNNGAQNHLLLHDIVKNSTSLTANWKLLLSLHISTFVVLKLTLMPTLLRPAGSPPGGTEATPARGVPIVGASQTSKSSDTA